MLDVLATESHHFGEHCGRDLDVYSPVAQHAEDASLQIMLSLYPGNVGNVEVQSSVYDECLLHPIEQETDEYIGVDGEDQSCVSLSSSSSRVMPSCSAIASSAAFRRSQ